MSNLISREKVDRAIRECFKSQIDAIPKGKDSDYVIDRVDIILEHNKGLIDAIEKVSVEFDVDKVVDELNSHRYDNDYGDLIGGCITVGDVMKSKEVIEIVKKGGIE